MVLTCAELLSDSPAFPENFWYIKIPQLLSFEAYKAIFSEKRFRLLTVLIRDSAFGNN
ncbi:hypothetical protein FBY51_0256 [Zymomonas mobilis]|nr:hypothetical protein ZZ6_0590 [Zymomonas mobilis subsp. mobilis ATCC 29191]TQK78083.1 hypothetical protein FBY53_0733 [Zymomonas mobilis]TQL15273.1 hypothetical protein FBY51_0256 [Zymomonas mobilis]